MKIAVGGEHAGGRQHVHVGVPEEKVAERLDGDDETGLAFGLAGALMGRYRPFSKPSLDNDSHFVELALFQLTNFFSATCVVFITFLRKYKVSDCFYFLKTIIAICICTSFGHRVGFFVIVFLRFKKFNAGTLHGVAQLVSNRNGQ